MSTFSFPASLLAQAAHFETKQALLLVDLQNEFVKPDGKLFVPNITNFLPKLPPLVSKFRSKGDVFWIRTEYKRICSLVSPTTGGHTVVLKEFLESKAEGPSEGLLKPDDHLPEENLSLSASGLDFLKADEFQDPEAFLSTHGVASTAQCCVPGTVGSEYPDEITSLIDNRRDATYVKSDYSAFEGTSLLQDLRMGLVTKLYICGSLSNISVYATVLDAVTHGLSVTVIEDCLGFRDEACHIEAMRQMADSMCAEGIDFQELMDDLAGLLGDVVKEEDFPTKFHVSLTTPSYAGRAQTAPPSVGVQRPVEQPRHDHLTTGTSQLGAVNSHESIIKSDSSSLRSIREGTPEKSPPRKRSTSDLELEEPEHKAAHKPSHRRASHEAYTTTAPKSKPNRVRVRRPKKPSQDHPTENSTSMAPTSMAPTSTPTPPMLQSQSTGDIPMAKGTSTGTNIVAELSAMTNPSETDASINRKPPSTARWKRRAVGPSKTLGPDDSIGEGDSLILYGLLPSNHSTDVFNKLQGEVKWQKMYHRSGEVPRLVAVQGATATSPEGTSSSTVVPIYRHPADESPELLPFSSTVEMIREHAEVIVRHPLNHVLIQLYRGGEDNISEHSDKTLDIVRGSKIVNYSCGAMRTMTLRTKKSAMVSLASGGEDLVDTGAEELDVPIRPSQRIQMPHNSLFVLGERTNQRWLHSIRADKRPVAEKSPAELDYGGERISLTFRNIGTFVDTEQQTIWGQGATVKIPDADSPARKILSGAEAEREGEKMIRAFGQENHLSGLWRWEEWYGGGFDVVNFTETKTEATG